MDPIKKLGELQSRILTACKQAGRDTQSVRLLAVSKGFSLSDILEFYGCGQTAFGENYLQEAIDKITHLADHPIVQPVQWHFLGPIQSNKTKSISENFDWVHSVERLKIAQRLSEQRPQDLPPLNVLVQINTSGESSKSGVKPQETMALCHAISRLPRIRLRGLMTIPGNTGDSVQLRQEFLQCKGLFDALKEEGLKLDTLSMGMSADLELAIECGSTCVRVGSALFGPRPSTPE